MSDQRQGALSKEDLNRAFEQVESHNIKPRVIGSSRGLDPKESLLRFKTFMQGAPYARNSNALEPPERKAEWE